MYFIGVNFQPENGRLDGRHITAQGINGLFFHVLEQYDPAGGRWLHQHSAPKPYSVISFFTDGGELAGLRYATVTEDTATLVGEAWQHIFQKGDTLQLGRYQRFNIGAVEIQPGPSFTQLAEYAPVSQLALRFLSPTSFRQGPGSLPLPMPSNVFRQPFLVWNTFAPPLLAIPDKWLTWCERNVFVIAHDIQTAEIALSREETFTGFVGDVTFATYKGDERSLRIWHALARLATFCGIGRKTTMGMGAVTLLT